MLVADTQVLTDSGWKNIQDIAGNDRVLVRNFIGYAEFIQPFALKKRKYDGEVIEMAGRHFSVTTTPDHQIVYKKGVSYRKCPAKDFKISSKIFIPRLFRYQFSEEPKRESIRIYDEFGDHHAVISAQDWYKLLGFVITKGYIKTGYGRPMLHIMLHEEIVEEEISILSDILSRIGVPFHVQYTEKTRPKVVVSSKNTLAARIITRLGSSVRKEMYLPDKIIYQTTKDQADVLIKTIFRTKQVVTTNTKLLETLSMLCTLSGYGSSVQVTHPNRFTDNDSWIMTLLGQVKYYRVKKLEKKKYSGYIYGIDLFEGQIYAKTEGMSIWTNPK